MQDDGFIVLFGYLRLGYHASGLFFQRPREGEILRGVQADLPEGDDAGVFE